MSSCCWSWFQMIPSYYFNAWKPGTQRIPSISQQQRTWVWQRSLKSCTTLQVLSRLLRLFTQRIAVPFFLERCFARSDVFSGVIKRMSSKVEQFKCHVLSSPFFWGVSWNFTFMINQIDLYCRFQWPALARTFQTTLWAGVIWVTSKKLVLGVVAKEAVQLFVEEALVFTPQDTFPNKVMSLWWP